MNLHATWLEVARTVARRSHCSRSQVGAVIVGADGRVLATGYNGPPAGFVPRGDAVLCSSYCERARSRTTSHDFDDCPAVHAELNALLYSDRSLRVGGAMYITRDPCAACAKAIAASGLKAVVWPFDRMMASPREDWAVDFLRDCGVEVVDFP